MPNIKYDNAQHTVKCKWGWAEQANAIALLSHVWLYNGLVHECVISLAIWFRFARTSNALLICLSVCIRILAHISNQLSNTPPHMVKRICCLCITFSRQQMHLCICLRLQRCYNEFMHNRGEWWTTCDASKSQIINAKLFHCVMDVQCAWGRRQPVARHFSVDFLIDKKLPQTFSNMIVINVIVVSKVFI